jgi:hypothetical protein
MKLSKGKIYKLYNKKKQSQKRFKRKCKRCDYNRSFRRKRPINLHRTSLKSMRGGVAGDDYDGEKDYDDYIDPMESEEFKKAIAKSAGIDDPPSSANVPISDDYFVGTIPNTAATTVPKTNAAAAAPNAAAPSSESQSDYFVGKIEAAPGAATGAATGAAAPGPGPATDPSVSS